MSGTASNDRPSHSWVAPDAPGDFPLANLPYGVFRKDGVTRPGTAIGDSVLDLRAVAAAGLLDAAVPDARALFAGATLNALVAAGKPVWRALRERLGELLASGNRELPDAGVADAALVPRSGVELLLPLEVGDYVDFYSSLEHATNVGKILRPGGEPLLPNWRSLPIGYHGRSGTLVAGGTPIVRPRGQAKAPDAAAPTFGPSRMLDFELELAFVTANGPPLGTPIRIEDAAEFIFGVALLNDWSARDIQAWEYQPLGPFLGKSFATSLAPWIVTLDALEPYRVAGPVQEPEPLAYLREEGAATFDIDFEVELSSEEMRRRDLAPQRISRSNFRSLYWSMTQQLAHLTSNGSTIRAGDVCASGTISGAAPESYGSMLELTWRGARPLHLPDGSARGFLEDGDRVTLRGSCGPGNGKPRIGLGEVSGTILPAR